MSDVYKLCVVCQQRNRKRLLFCASCGRSYDSALACSSTVADIILWAAKRSRWFAKRSCQIKQSE